MKHCISLYNNLTFMRYITAKLMKFPTRPSAKFQAIHKKFKAQRDAQVQRSKTGSFWRAAKIWQWMFLLSIAMQFSIAHLDHQDLWSHLFSRQQELQKEKTSGWRRGVGVSSAKWYYNIPLFQYQLKWNILFFGLHSAALFNNRLSRCLAYSFHGNFPLWILDYGKKKN